MKAHGLGVLAMFLATLAASPSHAADDDDPAALVLTGVDRYRHGDYEKAREMFARAYELAPSPRTLFNLALAELQSAHLVEGVRHMRAYLTELDAEPDKVVAIKTKWLPRAEAQTSRVQVVAPSGAEVEIDGHVQGRAPLAIIDVSVGDHDVVARDTSWSRSEHVTAGGGELVLVHFAQIVTADGARAESGLPAVTARPTPHTRLPAAKLVTTVALGSGAVAAAGLGIAFAIASYNDARFARDLLSQIPVDPAGPNSRCLRSPLPSQCTLLQADNRAAIDAQHLSNTFFIGAGVLAGAAAATWLLWPVDMAAATPSFALRIVPIAGLDPPGLVLRGQW